MIAYLQGEEKGEKVRVLLLDKTIVKLAHSVNLCEVLYDFGPISNPDNKKLGQEALETLFKAGVIERSDLDGEFWRDVAFLIAERRSHPPRPEKPREKARLALGDGFGLALARRLNAEFVTADRGEIEPLHERKLCRAVFLR